MLIKKPYLPLFIAFVAFAAQARATSLDALMASTEAVTTLSEPGYPGDPSQPPSSGYPPAPGPGEVYNYRGALYLANSADENNDSYVRHWRAEQICKLYGRTLVWQSTRATPIDCLGASCTLADANNNFSVNYYSQSSDNALTYFSKLTCH